MAEKSKTESKRRHRATYAADKRNGGWLVRITGPNADRFVDVEVPVTMKDGTEHQEKLTRLIWSGPDVDPKSGDPTGLKAGLYRFESRPRETERIEF